MTSRADSSSTAGEPLRVAVVGHTNTGKTSLLRTLLRDVAFGEVSDRPATTRHVEGAVIAAGGQPLVELFDTPGLEDSIGLLEHIDQQPGSSRRQDDHQTIACFLQSAEARPGGRFAQEAKAIRQLMACDVGLYVIDARDRVLGKHRDELEILRRCGRPIVPVLNFTASPEQQAATWREHLSRAGLHAVAEFDTVVLDEHGERRLFEKIRTLVDRHQHTIEALVSERHRQRQVLEHASCALIADMLIDIAAFRVRVPIDGDPRQAPEIEHLRQRVRQREQKCVGELLDLHKFRPDDARPADLPIENGQWGLDLFSPAALRQFGVRTGSAAAAGAMAGLAVDAISHGITLGAATALGATIGGAVSLAQTHGRRALDRLRGYTDFACDNATLRLLMARQLALLAALQRRGHASMQPIDLRGPSQVSGDFKSSGRADHLRFPGALDEARLHPDWSSLGKVSGAASLPLLGSGRRGAMESLTTALQDRLALSAGR